ncbi:alpha-L-fucosidase [Aeoliella sp. ICT_H6.2]|uniref:alpha-L-fucosidase n=1 Tax=Aeoliella straminimaris TaxID=2954799 RepID=A0A9X2JGV5_9BACT|nr:alpha-L-fucosidase [Aeoliella straminimaris]MCO6045146.1 alpha-L-fucosidase [Aeoliella straminimaris]
MHRHFASLALGGFLFGLLTLGVLLPYPAQAEEAQYTPAPENLENREAFQDDKFGIFIHWGVYSELGRGEWVMNNEKIKVEDYKPVAEKFNPTEYDPAEWVALFKKAGAKYITITSKHHDGFALWDSKVTDWDVVDATPYGKDLLKPLAEECEKQDMKLFFYHSHLDWSHPDYYPRGRTGQNLGRPDEGDFDKYLNYMDAQLAELLVGDYGDVAGIWFDGWWDQRDYEAEDPQTTKVDWRLDKTYGLIHSLQPGCMIGNNHHVAPFPGEDFQMFERDLPGQNKSGHSKDSTIGDLPLESCDTINGSWGYNANDKKIKSKKDLVHYLVKAAGQNANLLLNVGPKPDGTIQPEFVARLTEMGEWLDEYGDSIYGTRGGSVGLQEWGVTTTKGDAIYVHILQAPEAGEEGWVTLAGTADLAVGDLTLFGSEDEVPHQRGDDGNLQVKLPAGAAEAIDTILVTQAAE